jgi:hypothetical protein
MFLHEEVQRHLNADGERLQQEASQIFEVFGKFGDVLAKSWQGLLAETRKAHKSLKVNRRTAIEPQFVFTSSGSFRLSVQML